MRITRPCRRRIRWMLVLGIFGGCLCITHHFIFVSRNGARAVAIRNWLFTQPLTEVGEIERIPTAEEMSKFIEGRKSERLALRQLLESDPDTRLKTQQIESITDTIGRVKALVELQGSRSYTFINYRRCGLDGSLRERLRLLQAGEGCCSDHSSVFSSIAYSLGIMVRQAFTAKHAMVNVYVPELRSWIFVDPQQAVMAKNAQGEYLSLPELARRIISAEEIQYEFFGHSPNHFLTESDAEFVIYYRDPSDFHRISYRSTCDKFDEENFHSNFQFLPKGIAHLYGHLTGKLPPYMVASYRSETPRRR